MTFREQEAQRAIWDKRYCDASFYELPWGRELISTQNFKCFKCGSNLIYQMDRLNSESLAIKGKCLDCREEYTAEATLDMILLGEFGYDRMSSCFSCQRLTFVCAGEVCRCYACGLSLEGKRCSECGEPLVSTYDYVVHPELCEVCL